MSITTAIENHFNQISLKNSDGYSVAQYEFIDLESAIESYGIIANSFFVMVDANRSFTTIAPIVLGEACASSGDDRGLFGDATQAFNIFPDEIRRVN